MQEPPQQRRRFALALVLGLVSCVAPSPPESATQSEPRSEPKSEPERPHVEQPSSASTQAEFEALYARQVARIKERDVPGLMQFDTPDYTVKLLDGGTMSRQQFEQELSHYYTSGQLVRQTSFSYTVLELSVQGEQAVALVEQRDRRVQLRRDNKPHDVESIVVRRDTWVRTREGWKRRLTEEVEQKKFTVDGLRSGS